MLSGDAESQKTIAPKKKRTHTQQLICDSKTEKKNPQWDGRSNVLVHCHDRKYRSSKNICMHVVFIMHIADILYAYNSGTLGLSQPHNALERSVARVATSLWILRHRESENERSPPPPPLRTVFADNTRLTGHKRIRIWQTHIFIISLYIHTNT